MGPLRLLVVCELQQRRHGDALEGRYCCIQTVGFPFVKHVAAPGLATQRVENPQRRCSVLASAPSGMVESMASKSSAGSGKMANGRATSSLQIAAVRSMAALQG